MITRLKDTFKNAAQNNRLVRGFINNSERISSIGYLAANLTLISKAGTAVDLETLSGALYLAATAALWKAKDNPFYMKMAGVISIGGAVAMGAAGYGQPGGTEQMVSALPVIATGYLLTRTAPKQIAKKGKNLLSQTFNRASGFVKNYPILSGGLLDFTAVPLLAAAAIKQGDVGLGLAAAAWAVGAPALSASDPNIKKLTKPANDSVSTPKVA